MLIEWPSGEAQPTKYWLSTLAANFSLRNLVRMAKHRWIIERDYEERKLVKRGILPTDDGWGGWLGKYQANLLETAVHLLEKHNGARGRELQREKGLGR